MRSRRKEKIIFFVGTSDKGYLKSTKDSWERVFIVAVVYNFILTVGEYLYEDLVLDEWMN